MKTISELISRERKQSSRAASTFEAGHLDADYESVQNYLTWHLQHFLGDDADLQHVPQVAEWLSSPQASPWMLLTGTPGTGKTTLLRAIMDAFRRWGVEFKKFPASDLPALFLDNVEITHDQLLCGHWCRFLLLDDVGTEPVEVKSFGNAVQPFVRIVEARYDRRLPLIVTSNLAPADFLNTYGARTFDRMRELCEIITFDGPSLRAK